MKCVKMVLLTLVVAFPVVAMESKGGYDQESLLKEIQLTHMNKDTREEVAPQGASRALPTHVNEQRDPSMTESGFSLTGHQDVILTPVTALPFVQEPSQAWKTLSLVAGICKIEGSEIGKSVLYYGANNLCDLGLRRIQRNVLPDYAKTFWVVRCFCCGLRALTTSVLMEMYPKNLIAQPTSTIEYIRRVLVIDYMLEKHMYKTEPSKLFALYKAMNFVPPKK